MIVLLHGWGADSSLMNGVAALLKGRVIVPDLYGFGKSPLPESGLTLDGYVEGVRELIDVFGGKAVVVGHSFGGRIGIRLSARYPDRVSGLVLTSAAGMKPKRGASYYFRVAGYKLGKRLGLDLSGAGSADYRNAVGAMRKTFVSVVREYLESDAARIQADTLLVWGDKDSETPVYMAKRLRGLIGKSALIVLEGCGHYAYLERMRQFAGIVNAYTRGLNL